MELDLTNDIICIYQGEVCDLDAVHPNHDVSGPCKCVTQEFHQHHEFTPGRKCPTCDGAGKMLGSNFDGDPFVPCPTCADSPVRGYLVMAGDPSLPEQSVGEAWQRLLSAVIDLADAEHDDAVMEASRRAREAKAVFVRAIESRWTERERKLVEALERIKSMSAVAGYDSGHAGIYAVASAALGEGT